MEFRPTGDRQSLTLGRAWNELLGATYVGKESSYLMSLIISFVPNSLIVSFDAPTIMHAVKRNIIMRRGR